MKMLSCIIDWKGRDPMKNIKRNTFTYTGNKIKSELSQAIEYSRLACVKNLSHQMAAWVRKAANRHRTCETLAQGPGPCRNRWLFANMLFLWQMVSVFAACILSPRVLQSNKIQPCSGGRPTIAPLIPSCHPQKPRNHSALCSIWKTVQNNYSTEYKMQIILIKMHSLRQRSSC
jgi:hypothetical protein